MRREDRIIDPLSIGGSHGSLAGARPDHWSRLLIVAPYVGEFGWELMNWQGYVRRVVESGTWDRVVYCGQADRRALYLGRSVGTPGQFCTVDGWNPPGEANEDHRIESDGRKVSIAVIREWVEECMRRSIGRCGSVAGEWTILQPNYDGRLIGLDARDQRIEGLRLVGRRIEADIVLVRRQRAMAKDRNLPDEWWHRLTGEFERHGLRVVECPGRLEGAIRALSSCRLAIGGSTGGMHLASLCQCPHYVWGSGSEEKWTSLRMSNRQRYETFWNPLGTACEYDECGWRPSVGHVAERAMSALGRIGLAETGRRIRRQGGTLWRTKRMLARFVQNGSAAAPWRLRQLVMERMI